MHLNRFDLNLLVALDVLLEEKSVTRAADRLFVSQPAMSGSLQRLRERFNDPLLVRVGRRMELTARARTLVTPVREVLLRIESTLDNEPVFDPGRVERVFRLAVSDYVAAILMPDLMRLLEQRAPGISIQLVSIGDQALEDVRSGRTDLLIRALADPLSEARANTGDIEAAPLFVDSWVCAADANHPELAGCDYIELEHYTRLPHYALNLGRNSPLLEEIARAQQSLHIDIRATAPHFISLVMMLPGTRHLVMLPRRLGLLLQRQIPLLLLPPPMTIAPLQERMLWHVREQLEPGHSWLRQQLQRVAAGLPTERQPLQGRVRQSATC